MTTYHIRTKTGPDSYTERIVEAKTRAQAVAHVAADTIQASICETADAVRLGAAGVKVEKAGELAP